MPVTELYNVATWSFVLGNRDVEEALRDPSVRSLVVRGGVGTVLSTLSAIAELRSDVSVHVPANALSAALPDLSAVVPAADVLPRLLRETYGVRVSYDVPEDGLLLAFLSGRRLASSHAADGSAAGAAVRALRGRDVVLGLGGPGVVPVPLRGVAASAVSTFRWDGRNAFSCTAVEEAVWEVGASRLVVLSDDPVRLFYTAVGAVDAMLVEDARHRDPSTLQLWDVLAIGERVTAVLVGGDWATYCDDPLPSGRMVEHVLRHASRALGVTSVMPDFGYGPVPGHKIAIDVG